jgi:nicotinamidase-related amidase
MHSKVLVVIDMQNDFITGPLGNRECEATVQEVSKIIREGGHDYIYVTQDTHGNDYLSTQEGRNLPIIHCISGTKGWDIVPEVQEALNLKKNYKTFKKGTFGSIELAEAVSSECLPDAEVDFVGVCTDICVISNAILMKAVNPEMRLSVISRACAGTTEDNHAVALAAMRSCQIDIVRSAADTLRSNWLSAIHPSAACSEGRRIISL